MRAIQSSVDLIALVELLYYVECLIMSVYVVGIQFFKKCQRV